MQEEVASTLAGVGGEGINEGGVMEIKGELKKQELNEVVSDKYVETKKVILATISISPADLARQMTWEEGLEFFHKYLLKDRIEKLKAKEPQPEVKLKCPKCAELRGKIAVLMSERPEMIAKLAELREKVKKFYGTGDKKCIAEPEVKLPEEIRFKEGQYPSDYIWEFREALNEIICYLRSKE